MGSSPQKIVPEGASAPIARSSAAGGPRLSLILSSEVVLMALIRLPFALSFIGFAFGDRGSWLTVRYLIERGARPGIDFGYSYGLLPIWLSAGWFGIFGATPYAYQAAMVVCGVAMAWGIARMANSLALPKAAIVLIIIALPFAIQSTYPSGAHAAEAALLCNALAEHAAGRRSRALALATAGCFAKPSMGYVYGFILLVLIQVEIYQRRNEAGRNTAREALRTLAPALITGALLIVILGAAYGPLALGRSLIPLSGARNYAAMDFGFFHGSGSYFWYGTPIAQCLFSVVGFWFAASLWLVAAAAAASWRLIRGASPETARRYEFIVTAAVLHALFVVAFFGGPSSWSYYSYVMIMGAAAACSGGRAIAAATMALALFATAAQTSHRAADFVLWRTMTPTADTAGLWASSGDHDDWVAVLTAIRGGRAAVISAQGCASLFAPGQLAPNDFAYMLPGIMRRQQFNSALQKFSEATMVLAIVAPGYGDALGLWPQLRELLQHRALVLKGDFYALYRKPTVP